MDGLYLKRNMEIGSLIESFLGFLGRLGDLPENEQILLLLCAKELGLQSTMTEMHARCIADRITSDPKELTTIDLLRQVLALKFNIREPARISFVVHWTDTDHIGRLNLVFKTHLYGLVVEQRALFDPILLSSAATWFQQYPKTFFVRSEGWLPRYLCQLGLKDEATRRASALLEKRSSNGSWKDDKPSSAAVLYALSVSGVVDPLALTKTANFLLVNAKRDICGSIETETNLLKALHALQIIPVDVLDDARRKLKDDSIAFVSYSFQDSNTVENIRKGLEEKGIKTWVSESQIKGGGLIVEEIESAMAQSDIVLLVLSNKSIRSNWVKLEMQTAIMMEMEGLLNVIPLKIDDCDVPLLLRSKLVVDLSEDFDTGLVRLSEAIRGRRMTTHPTTRLQPTRTRKR
jgi:hypothetical protein